MAILTQNCGAAWWLRRVLCWCINFSADDEIAGPGLCNGPIILGEGGSMGYLDELAKYQKSAKQKEFNADFLVKKDVEGYEFWDEIEIGKESVLPCQVRG